MSESLLFVVAIAHAVIVIATYAAIVESFLRAVGRTSSRLVWVVCELKPFYWPSSFLYLGWFFSNPNAVWENVLSVLSVLAGWALIQRASKDDDRWKRRKKKLLEKISVEAGRLTVVPA